MSVPPTRVGWGLRPLPFLRQRFGASAGCSARGPPVACGQRQARGVELAVPRPSEPRFKSTCEDPANAV
eukprot:5242853-Lingulodinium_polyedra.AAC.1